MNKKIFKYFITVIILIFLIAYFIEYTGYYEYSLHNKKVLTEEQIAKFEDDVSKGIEIDLNSYLKENTIDYSNSLTRTTTLVNLKLNKYIKKALTGGLNLVSKFIK